MKLTAPRLTIFKQQAHGGETCFVAYDLKLVFLSQSTLSKLNLCRSTPHHDFIRPSMFDWIIMTTRCVIKALQLTYWLFSPASCLCLITERWPVMSVRVKSHDYCRECEPKTNKEQVIVTVAADSSIVFYFSRVHSGPWEQLKLLLTLVRGRAQQQTRAYMKINRNIFLTFKWQ